MPKERHISSYREKIRLSFHPIGEPNATFGPYLGIRYEASGPIDAGVLVRDMVGHCYLWDDVERIYGEGARDGGVRLEKLGYVRLVCKTGKLPRLDDMSVIGSGFELETDLSVTPPMGRVGFLVRVETGEVYSEYFGHRSIGMWDTANMSGYVWNVSRECVNTYKLGNGMGPVDLRRPCFYELYKGEKSRRRIVYIAKILSERQAST